MKATRVIQCHGSEHLAALWALQTAASPSLSSVRSAAGEGEGGRSLNDAPPTLPLPCVTAKPPQVQALPALIV